MQVPTFEAENKFRELLDEVAQGREVTITRGGVPVARLIPVVPGFDRAKARRAADGLRNASRGLRLDGVSIRDLVNEGRG